MDSVVDTFDNGHGKKILFLQEKIILYYIINIFITCSCYELYIQFVLCDLHFFWWCGISNVIISINYFQNIALENVDDAKTLDADSVS